MQRKNNYKTCQIDSHIGSLLLDSKGVEGSNGEASYRNPPFYGCGVQSAKRHCSLIITPLNKGETWQLYSVLLIMLNAFRQVCEITSLLVFYYASFMERFLESCNGNRNLRIKSSIARARACPPALRLNHLESINHL